jgi:hypothetical protein
VLLVVLAGCRFGFDKRGDGDGGNGSDSDVNADIGAPAAFVPYWTSGTRLRARLLVPVEGGDPVWFGWRDSQLGMDCVSRTAGDGVERCVHEDQRATVFFSDAGCTQRLGWIRPATCGVANHVFFIDTMGRSHTLPIATAYTGPIFEDQGTCLPSGGPVEGTLYNLGAEIAPAQLVAAQYTNVQVGDYQRPMQGFTDGARAEVGSLLLTTGQGGCYPVADTLGTSHCRANLPRASAVYSDSLCMQRAYYWDRQAYEAATTAQLMVVEPAACETSSKIYNTISDVSSGSYYKQTPSGCQMVASSSLGKLYTAAEIANPFPIGTTVIGPRRGRLGWLYWIGPDGMAMAVRYWDHDLQMPCNPINASDGKLRCLPASLTTIDAYTDAACGSTPKRLEPACFAGTPVQGPGYRSCIDEFTVNALPASTQSASLFGDTCSSISTPGGFVDPAVIGPEVSPSMFAELTEIVE